LSDWDYGTRAKREQERAEKAEAEVKRLKEYYSRFILVSPIEAGRIEKMEDEVKEIRAALGDDGRRTHKELLELATKASQWREWKEKYIDLRNAHIAEGQDPAGTIWEHADKLQKKLKEAEAGIERLKASVQHYQDQALHFQHAQ
jgi:chromosome segregation ATPase